MTSTLIHHASSELEQIQKHEIELLRAKLEFTKQQVMERDQQLQYYKLVVDTLQTLLKEETVFDMGVKYYSPPQKNHAGSQSMEDLKFAGKKPQNREESMKRKNQIKGRKVVSFVKTHTITMIWLSASSLPTSPHTALHRLRFQRST